MGKKAEDTVEGVQSLDSLAKVESAIRLVRDQRVIFDNDLASLYGVQTKRLNEQVRRNADRFGEKYAFQLTNDEFAVLRSQIATSKTGRGGRRYPPWVFTEYGVVMAATILDSDKAIEASKLIVDVFVEVKRRFDQERDLPASSSARALAPPPSPLERFSGFGEGIGSRLQKALDLVLDSVIDTKRRTTIREEAQDLINESIQHLKERLKKQGLENEEISARVTKLLAEAEKEKALAAKTRAEAETLEFAVIIRKLRVLLEVQRAIQHERLDLFLDVLRELGES